MRKILVVENDPWWQDALPMLFEEDYFFFTNSSEKAIDFINKNYIDLVILNESVLKNESFMCIKGMRQIYKKKILFIPLDFQNVHR